MKGFFKQMRASQTWQPPEDPQWYPCRGSYKTGCVHLAGLVERASLDLESEHHIDCRVCFRKT